MQRNLITLSKRTLIFRGVQIRERGSISASGSGPGGPNPRCREEVQICCDTMSFAIKSQYSSLGNT